jgi:hypothetical protein
MKNKSQELDMRNIMQGLEEFATFMSYQSNSLGLRIISVETVAQDRASQVKEKAQILSLNQRKKVANSQDLKRALSFQDRQVH